MKLVHVTLVYLMMTSCQGAGDANKLQSGYGATYPITVDMLDQKYVHVERIRQNDDGLGIHVYYTGPLRDPTNKPLPALFVKIHYPDGSFVTDFIDAIGDNGAHTEYYFSNTCIEGIFDGCGKYATTSMQYLLNPFVKIEPGHMGPSLLALDIEFAFVTADGQWDSQSGANYRFKFAALESSY